MTNSLLGRAALIAQLIYDHQEHVNRIVAGSIEFHLSPDGQVQMEFHERMKAVRA